MVSAGLELDGRALFPGGGHAGEVLRACDWSSTPLGAPDRWPVSLGAYVSAMLATRQPTCIFWGGDYVNLYNDGFVPLLGEKHPQAMGRSAREVWSDAWPVVGELLNGVLVRNEAVLFEEMLVPIIRNGRLEDAWWNYSYSPLVDDDRRTAGILVVATETTAAVHARKELEAAKAEAELARQELHAVFMQTPLPMALLKGPEHRFALVNAPYRELVGHRDVDGRALRAVFTEEEVSSYEHHLDHVYAAGEPVVVRETPMRLDGASGAPSERYLDIGFHPYRDAGGTPVGVLTVMHDVTDKVLARIGESRLREEAEAANRAKDDFLAVVSHELRNPLNAILGWARTVRESADPARLVRGLEVIERNAVAQASLIDDILDVSRIVSGKLLLVPRRVRVADVVRGAVDSARPALAGKRIRFEVDLDDEELRVVADPDRLQQIVWNLLSNAAKFTPEGGAARLEVRRIDTQVRIRVSDTGQGIAPAFLPFVFDRFRQGDPSTTKRHAGLGLGLSIVRHLAELHGGAVAATSEGVGRGATFDVMLPVRAIEPRVPSEHPAASAASHEASPRGQGAAEPLSGAHVLLVDDHADARDLVATVLRDAGANVTEVSSGTEAFSALGSGGVSVIVSDIGMPQEDGYALMRRVRSEDTMRDIPSLALTAYARAEDRAQARAAGFDDHAAKPVDPDELVRRVATLVRGGRYGVPA